MQNWERYLPRQLKLLPNVFAIHSPGSRLQGLHLGIEKKGTSNAPEGLVKGKQWPCHHHWTLGTGWAPELLRAQPVGSGKRPKCCYGEVLQVANILDLDPILTFSVRVHIDNGWQCSGMITVAILNRNQSWWVWIGYRPALFFFALSPKSLSLIAKVKSKR